MVKKFDKNIFLSREKNRVYRQQKWGWNVKIPPFFCK
jgi:hypothetical protein